MKKLTFLFFMVICQGLFGAPLHLDLEMSSDEYRILLNKTHKNTKELHADDPAITHALKLGERLSKWIALVNSLRIPEAAIRLTSASTRRGIPIDKPNMYSPSIIKKDTESILSEIPSAMKNVITSSGELPSEIPMDDETFITHARKIDRNYQSAARYKSVDAYRSYYVRAASKDVRGHYYLKTNNIGENELRDINLIPEGKISPIKEALVLVCLNALEDLPRCRAHVRDAFTQNSLAPLYNRYIGASIRIWENFFKIPKEARRQDILWSGTKATVPFNIPEIPKFGPYLRRNIEDEFRWKGWSLDLNFGTYPSGPYLKFEPGVVPHVNELGGNEIVMDSNQPIEEYESQWTIRHEFGHVLGLPDCYHEFYDTAAKAYVNYQLDVTDLMCSRAGNMNKRIYNELKKAYAK